MDMFFNQPKFPAKEKYYSGEMLGDENYPTIGEQLNTNNSFSFRKIAKNSSSEVYSVIFKDNEHSSNFYCYLINESGDWKINAIRKFLLPKFVYDAADSMAKFGNVSDSVSNLQTMIMLMTNTDEELKSFLSIILIPSMN